MLSYIEIMAHDTQPIVRRIHRRVRAIGRFLGRRIAQLGRAVRAAGILALVGLVLFSPMLIDDRVFRASYMMLPSEDAITITAPTQLSVDPPVMLTRGVLALPPALSGRPRSGAELAAVVREGNARMVLKSPRIEIALAPRSDALGHVDLSYLQALTGPLLQALSPLIEALQATAFETLAVRDGTVVFGLGGDRVETLTAVDADVTTTRRTSTRLRGTATLRGEPIRFDVTIGAGGRRQGETRAPITARIEATPIQVTIDGRLRLDRGVALIGATADVTVPDARALANWLGHVWPEGPGLRAFTARGTLDWAGPTLSMTNGRFRLDGSEAAGTLAVTLGPQRATVAGTLAFGTLDLTPHVTPPPTGAPPADRPMLSMLRDLRDLRWPLRHALDADLRLSAERVRLATATTGRTAATLSLREGQALWNVAEMVLADGGQVVGEIAVGGPSEAPEIAVRGRLEDVDLATMSMAALGFAMARGRGQLSIDVVSKGAVSGIGAIRAAEGRIEVGLAEGGTLPCSHRALAAAAARRLAATPASSPAAGAGAGAPAGSPGGAPWLVVPAAAICRDAVTIQPVTVTATVGAGRLQADQVEVVAGDQAIRLTGHADLLSGDVDIAVTSGLVPPPAPSRGGATTGPAIPPDRTVMMVRSAGEMLHVAPMP